MNVNKPKTMDTLFERQPMRAVTQYPTAIHSFIFSYTKPKTRSTQALSSGLYLEL